MGRPCSKLIDENERFWRERKTMLHEIENLMDRREKEQILMQKNIEITRKLMEKNDLLVRAIRELEKELNADIITKWLVPLKLQYVYNIRF